MATGSSILTLQKQRQLLELEYEEEKRLFEKQTETTGINRKIRQGVCWFPLRVRKSYYNSLNQFTIEVERTEQLDTDHSFEPGKPVCFFTEEISGDNIRRGGEGRLKYMNIQGQVSYVDGDIMTITLPGPEDWSALQSAYRLGVQLYLDETTYKLMFEALDRVLRAKTGRLPELREIFHGTQPAGNYAFQPIRFPWLNTSQETAVNLVLRAKDVAIVHGPPGTGKTTTLVEAIYETLHRESQVLVCAQSNMAVDWIAEKLVDRGVPVLRIGNPARVNDKMLSFTYERRFESHPSYPQLWAIRKAIRDLYANRKSHASGDSFHQKIARLRERATELEISINEALFNEARVVASTLTGSANRVLTGKKFSTLFIDEAAQALEAACWIAIQKARRVILAGDHQQLPPTIKSFEAKRGGLDRTLMQAIAENKPATVHLLEIQYRMNEEIMRFPAEWFYGGKLKSAPEVKYRGILDWDTPIEWIDTQTDDDTIPEETTDGLSRCNRAEAEMTIETIRRYFEKIGKERILSERIDLGLISPYKGQVVLLRQLLKKDPYFKPFRQAITVNTVDGFQGQERDIIVISLVRANQEGNIGFLNDLRRMNVAITRARMKLILLGNKATLCRSPFYKKLESYIESLNE